MDRFIAAFPAIEDQDLMLCRDHGVAYQADRDFRVYVPYYEKCGGYEGQEIARKINAGRVALVNLYAGSDAQVLDIGVGAGEFIKHRPYTCGFDTDPKAAGWLQDRGLWSENIAGFRVFTFWDVLEHVENPEDYFGKMTPGSYLFTCLPIFPDLDAIRASKHYRPGEHLYYWTEEGFTVWIKLYGFRLLERSEFETEAGRDSIVSFAFKRDQVEVG